MTIAALEDGTLWTVLLILLIVCAVVWLIRHLR